MIILLNTSTALCELTIFNDDRSGRIDYNWQADRGLAKGLLKFLDDKLKLNNKSWLDISAIGVYQGPGSFTGLRIGLTVANTIADAQNIPIVSGQGESWQNEILEKISSNKNEKIVLPFYGSEANITKPRK